MTMPFQIYERVQELRCEIAEIAVADEEKCLSGREILPPYARELLTV